MQIENAEEIESLPQTQIFQFLYIWNLKVANNHLFEVSKFYDIGLQRYYKSTQFLWTVLSVRNWLILVGSSSTPLFDTKSIPAPENILTTSDYKEIIQGKQSIYLLST